MYKSHPSTRRTPVAPKYKTHPNFCLHFLVCSHIEIIVISHPCHDAPSVLVLSFRTQRCVFSRVATVDVLCSTLPLILSFFPPVQESYGIARVLAHAGVTWTPSCRVQLVLFIKSKRDRLRREEGPDHPALQVSTVTWCREYCHVVV